MGATFANSPPPPRSAWFWINLSTPIPNHHTHTQLLIANENDKGLLDTTHIIIISREQIYAEKTPCKSHLY